MKKKLTLLLAFLSLTESTRLYTAAAAPLTESIYYQRVGTELQISPVPHTGFHRLLDLTIQPFGHPISLDSILQTAHAFSCPVTFMLGRTEDNSTVVMLVDQKFHPIKCPSFPFTIDGIYRLFAGEKGTYIHPELTHLSTQPQNIVPSMHPYPASYLPSHTPFQPLLPSFPYVAPYYPDPVYTAPYTPPFAYAAPYPTCFSMVSPLAAAPSTPHISFSSLKASPLSPMIEPNQATPAVSTSSHPHASVNEGLKSLLADLQLTGAQLASTQEASRLAQEKEQKALADAQEAQAREQEAARIAAEEEQRIFIAAEQAAQKTKQEEEQKALAAAQEAQAREQEAARRAAEEEQQRIFIAAEQAAQKTKQEEEEQKALAAAQEAQAREQAAARRAAEEEQKALAATQEAQAREQEAATKAAQEAARIAAEEEQRLLIAAEQAAQKTKQEEEQKALAAAQEAQAREQEAATKAAQEAALIAAEKLTTLPKITQKELQAQKKLQGDRDRKAAQEAAAAQKKAQEEIAENQKLLHAQKGREVAAQQKAEKAVMDKKKADKKAAAKKKVEEENKLLSRAAAAAVTPLSQSLSSPKNMSATLPASQVALTPTLEIAAATNASPSTPAQNIPPLSFEARFEAHKKQLCPLLENESYEEAKRIMREFLQNLPPHHIETVFKETSSAVCLALYYKSFCGLPYKRPRDTDLIGEITLVVADKTPYLLRNEAPPSPAIAEFLDQIIKSAEDDLVLLFPPPFSFLDTDSTPDSFKETCAQFVKNIDLYRAITSPVAPTFLGNLLDPFKKLFKRARSIDDLLYAVHATTAERALCFISVGVLLDFLKDNPSYEFPQATLKALVGQSTLALKTLIDNINGSPMECPPSLLEFLTERLQFFNSRLETLSSPPMTGAAAANREE
jgi:hypothetical protein